MLGRIPGHLRSDIRGDKSGVDTWIAFQDRAQVTVFPARIAFNVKYIDLFIHNSDASFDSVVDHRNFVVKGLDNDGNLCSPLLIHIDTEIDVFELQPTVKLDRTLRYAPAIDHYLQSRHPLLVSLGLKLNPNGNPVTGVRHFLHYNIAYGDIVRIGQANRNRINRDTASAKVSKYRFGAA